MLNRKPEWLVLRGEPRPLRLPFRSRNPSRLARILEPVEVAEPVKGLAWLVCRALHCYYCVWPSGSYYVTYRRERVRDRLSGLRHEVVAEAAGLVDGIPAWRALWRGESLVVEGLECPAKVYPDGSVDCGARGRCAGPHCLVECLGSTRGP